MRGPTEEGLYPTVGREEERVDNNGSERRQHQKLTRTRMRPAAWDEDDVAVAAA